MPRSAFRKKPGYKTRKTGKKRGRVHFSGSTLRREYIRGKQSRARRKDFLARQQRVRRAIVNKRKALARLKRSGARSVNHALAKARKKRRDKKINKVVARVTADMNDDLATMYRQWVDPYAYVTDQHGRNHGLDQTRQALTNGAFVSLKNKILLHLVKRNETNFFQLDKFHGMISPSWKRLGNTPVDGAGAVDNQIWGDVGKDIATGQGNVHDYPLDIRAFREVEIPFLPCIPKDIAINANFKNHELSQFCRNNNKVKIKTNYWRFRFMATKNGKVENEERVNPFANAETDAKIPILTMTGDYNNIEPVFTFGGEIAEQTNNQSGTHDVITYHPNRPKEYRITAKRFAKVRIIVYERDQEEKHPVLFKHFMKYGKHNLDDNSFNKMAKMPGGSLLTGEEYRLDKRFYSKRKSKGDYPYLSDATEEERLNAGKVIIDKIINLPMGKEVTWTCNPIEGTVLTYDDSSRAKYTDNYGDGTTRATSIPVTPTTTTVSNDMNSMQTDTADYQGLPIDVNSNTNLYSPNFISGTPNPDNIKKAEYKPTNKQYGMFMLMYCQRAGIEYDIFQKFQYDK